MEHPMYHARVVVTSFMLASISVGSIAETAGPDATEFAEERRIRLWSNQLQNPDLVRSTYLRIDHLEGEDPGSWVYEWSAIADYFSDLAKGYESEGDTPAAREAWLKAAKLYGIARFPAKTLPGQVEAFEKHLEAYQRAGQYFDPPLSVLQIPYDDGHIKGYLHMPDEGDDSPPLILWNGGIDTWKGDSYNNIQPYLAEGFAVLTFDVLGTGESSGWVARYDGTDLHTAVINYMEEYPLVDGSSIAHVGFSFSGNLAARLSIIEPRLFAVIAACAGVHDAWIDMYDQSPWEIKEALSAALHLDPSDADGINKTTRGFSLVEQGLIDGADSVKVPLLVINGDKDDLVPVSDLRLLADSGQQTDLWIMGGDVHCFGQYRSIVMPKMAEWLTERLAEHQGSK